jgi:hypothetical protein
VSRYHTKPALEEEVLGLLAHITVPSDIRIINCKAALAGLASVSQFPAANISQGKSSASTRSHRLE